MSRKVVGASAGEAHTLALTGDGSVFSWGRGTFGRLGTGKDTDELFPVRVSFAEGRGGRGEPKFVEVAAGAYHSLALQDDGSVWSWGYNIYGQLGHNVEKSAAPKLIEEFKELGATNSLSRESNAVHDSTTLKVKKKASPSTSSLLPISRTREELKYMLWIEVFTKVHEVLEAHMEQCKDDGCPHGDFQFFCY